MSVQTNERLALWAGRLLARARAKETVNKYMDWGRRFATRYPTTGPEEIFDQVEQASESLYRQGYSPTTIRHFQCAMASFGVEGLGMQRSVARRMVTAQRRQPEFNLAAERDLLRMREHMRPDDRAMFDLAYFCGLRCSEVIAVRLGHLDMQNGTLTIPQTKGRKGRTVDVPDVARQSIQRQIGYAFGTWESDIKRKDTRVVVKTWSTLGGQQVSREAYNWPLFPSHSLERGRKRGESIRATLTGRGFRQAISDARKHAGVAVRVTPHRLRECYAREKANQGEPITKIARTLGHANLQTTAVYLRSLLAEQ